MKTRIVQTRFWDDLFVSEADLYTQHLYIYLLTCQYINISGIFQLTESKIKFEAKLTDKQFEDAKNNLQKAGKVFFQEGWVYVVNARKNNNYENSPKNTVALERELGFVPKAILSFFDSSIGTSMDSTHKSKTINQKPKTKEGESVRGGELETEAEEFIQQFNSIRESNYRSYRSWFSNFKHWRAVYSLEDMVLAVRKAKNHSFWKDKLTPDMLFRTNQDRIGDLLNSSQKVPSLGSNLNI